MQRMIVEFRRCPTNEEFVKLYAKAAPARR
jgi:hypothetical protein